MFKILYTCNLHIMLLEIRNIWIHLSLLNIDNIVTYSNSSITFSSFSCHSKEKVSVFPLISNEKTYLSILLFLWQMFSCILLCDCYCKYHFLMSI